MISTCGKVVFTGRTRTAEQEKGAHKKKPKFRNMFQNINEVNIKETFNKFLFNDFFFYLVYFGNIFFTNKIRLKKQCYLQSKNK